MGLRDGIVGADHMDQLLEEYLRVINDKDDQLHRLLRQLEDHQTTSRQSEEANKAKVKELLQELHSKETRVKELQRRCTRDEELNNSLIANTEALKKQLYEKDTRVDELAAAVAQSAEDKRVLSDELTTAGARLAALQEAKKHDDAAWAATQHDLSGEREAAAALRTQLQAATLAASEAQGQVEQLQTRMRSMLPRDEHTHAMEVVERAAAAAHTTLQEEASKLRHCLAQREDELRRAQQSLRTTETHAAELAETLQTTSKSLEQTRQQLTTLTLTAQQTEKELRDEATRHRKARQESAERVDELERAQARAHDAAQRLSSELQAAQLQYERCKAAAEKSHDGAQQHQKALQEQLRQVTEEAEHHRRQLDAKARAASECTDALSRAREDAARTQADLRERLATLTTAMAAKKDSSERLELELRKAQAELYDAQRRSATDERGISHKLDEVQLAVQRLQTQLRDKEEETRRMELVHSKEVQKLQHDHASVVEELRRRHEGEVRDLMARLERYRIELGEQAGGSKGLEKELQHIADVRREMRSEMDRLQNAADAKEAALHQLRREMEKQQSEAAHVAQRLAARERDAEALRQKCEEAERAHLDAAAAADRARGEAAAAKKAREAGVAASAALEEQLKKKDAIIAGLRHDIEAHIEEKQAAVKEAMQQRSQRDQAALTLATTEERLKAAFAELREAAQAQTKAQAALDGSRSEVRRLREEAEQRDAECARLARRAGEVEELARNTAEELRRTIHERDDTITQLRAEQATVLPRLNEERSKTLILQEKLQHQQEMARMNLEAVQERVLALEEEVAARESDVAGLRADKAGVEQQLADCRAEVTVLNGTLEGREHKYRQRKEEIERALVQVEEVKTATALTLQQAEAQTSAAAAIRDKYKKEKAKMQAVLQRMEERVNKADKHEQESRQREDDLLEKLAHTEEALRQLQDSMDSRVSEAKTHYEELCRQQEESFREATSDAISAEKQVAALQTQLVEAQRRTATVENNFRELQRHVAAYRMLTTEEYAEDALDMKRACMDAVLSAHRGLLSRAARGVRDGWAAAQRSTEVARDGVTELERQLARLQATHAAELQALAELHRRQLEAAEAMHREELARRQRETTEAERRAVAQCEALKRGDGDREQRTRALEESLQKVTALLDMEKEQFAAYRDRVAAEEVKRAEAARQAQDERRTLQRSYDKLKRQLEDRMVEQQHNLDELREQRAEVAALQRGLAEKERECKGEVERLQREVEKTAAVVTAREASEKRCDDLQKQLDFTQGQLETARASHQRVVNEQQALQRTRDARLDAAQSELATVAAERRCCQRNVESQEERIKELIKEVQALRRQEAELLSQLQARKAEVSALRERYANLESLKNISEASLAETQARERDLVDKIEELRNAQQLMQLCFDKQQEQLEVGRRLRQQDAQMRSRFSP